MKTTLLKTLVLIALSATFFASCLNSDNSGQKRGSSGKTLEILLVANKDVYCGTVKDGILGLLKTPQVALNQSEAIYDVVNIPHSSFRNNDMFQAHRNIIILSVSDTNRNKVYLNRDLWAQPQVVFEFSLTSRDSVMPFMERYMPMMNREIRNAEHARIKRAFRGIENYKVMGKLRDNFGFELTLSNEYQLSKMSPDFAWVRKEAGDFSIGILISTEPYKSLDQFAESVILNRLDTIMKRNVPGSVEGSYMGTERRIEAVSQNVDFNGNFCIETRGLWRLFGDFMGGPYVNYTFVAPDNRDVIMLTGYVYSPKQPKRDFLMQAESICYSIDFIDTTARK